MTMEEIMSYGLLAGAVLMALGFVVASVAFMFYGFGK